MLIKGMKIGEMTEKREFQGESNGWNSNGYAIEWLAY
jgi:hypothetical protein